MKMNLCFEALYVRKQQAEFGRNPQFTNDCFRALTPHPSAVWLPHCCSLSEKHSDTKEDAGAVI